MEDLYNIVYSQKKATPTIPMRTKFKWILDENNYCVAIQIATGILQVKAADNGIVRCERKYYSDYDAWAQTLSPSGMMTAYEPDKRTDFQKRLSMVLLDNRTDPQKVKYLQQLFKIRSRIWRDSSVESQICTLKEYEKFYDERIVYAQENPGLDMQQYVEKKNKAVNTRKRLEVRAKHLGAKKAAEEQLQYRRFGLTQLFVERNGTPYEIGYYYMGECIVGYDGKPYNTFAEMGIQGAPLFSILYRGSLHQLK
jgi:hypothetical protein